MVEFAVARSPRYLRRVVEVDEAYGPLRRRAEEGRFQEFAASFEDISELRALLALSEETTQEAKHAMSLFGRFEARGRWRLSNVEQLETQVNTSFDHRVAVLTRAEGEWPAHAAFLETADRGTRHELQEQQQRWLGQSGHAQVAFHSRENQLHETSQQLAFRDEASSRLTAELQQVGAMLSEEQATVGSLRSGLTHEQESCHAVSRQHDENSQLLNLFESEVGSASQQKEEQLEALTRLKDQEEHAVQRLSEHSSHPGKTLEEFSKLKQGSPKAAPATHVRLTT